MKKPAHLITDHAVIRYLEQVMGMDIEQIRREIGRKVDIAAEHPTASGVLVDGYRYKIVDGAVTTVHDASRPDVRTGRQRRERVE